MVNNLQPQHLIKRKNLNQANYLQSILQESHRLKLLTDSDMENIQLQSLQLLAKQIEHFTGGESSSVTTETAQNLFQSIFYTIGIYLKSLPDPDKSIEVLKQKPLADLYKKGRKLIEIQFEQAKQLLNSVQNNRINTDNYSYNDTIQNGLPVFFSAYDADFAAHDTPASIDYPLSFDKMELVGIEYISSYLQKLFWENEFCKNFTERNIHCVLRGYDERYQDLLINIFGLVLTNVVGSILINKNALELNIGPSDRTNLHQKLVNLPNYKLSTMLQNASSKVCSEFDVTDQSYQTYIAATVMNLSAALRNSLENNILESLFISFKDESQPFMLYEDGKKMNDELFRSITNEIRECRHTSDKIAIMQREIHSIADLVDVLDGSCFFGTEFLEVFSSLGDLELALLLKTLPTSMEEPYFLTENEKEWHNKLDYFLKEIDQFKRESIRGIAAKTCLGVSIKFS